MAQITGIIILVVLIAAIWVFASRFWAGSVQRFEPLLHDSVLRTRYGWKCPRCATAETPNCRDSQCGGPLFWVQQDTRIKCARCHRDFIAHPFLFKQLPRPRRVKCGHCHWAGLVSNWKIT